MFKSIISALSLSVVMILATCPTVFANCQKAEIAMFQEDIPTEVIAAICLQLEQEKVTDANTAIEWYRSGKMSITKVETGSYSVVTPSGHITILVTDAL